MPSTSWQRFPPARFVWLLLQYDAVYPEKAGTRPAVSSTETLPWIPNLKLEFAFRMDALAWVMSLLVLGVGALVLVYCARYFKNKDADLGGFGAQLLAFAGAMFGLVTADDLLLMFIFWELTTVLSYLLIGYARTRLSARRSALQALMVTTAGRPGHAGGPHHSGPDRRNLPDLGDPGQGPRLLAPGPRGGRSMPPSY